MSIDQVATSRAQLLPHAGPNGHSRNGHAHEPVPLVRLDDADRDRFAEGLAAVRRVAAKGAFTLGEEVERFEREFADYCGTRHAIGVSSGTEAIALALRALGVGSGDEVIVPANSFIATAEAVTLVGATPRLVDVDPHSQLITAEVIERGIGPRTRCVIPVHLYGATVEMRPILALAREAGIAVVEDAAQAHGARYEGRVVGTLGDLGCFSFYPTKNLGAWGDGGGVVTADPQLAERVRLLRSHGEQHRYVHELPGTTARLHAIQAAVLRVKLRYLEESNTSRRRVAEILRTALAEAVVKLPAEPVPGADHVYHLFVVRARNRDGLRAHLERHGVASAVHYPTPIHLTPAYADLGVRAGSLPIVERLAREVCTLPLWPAMSKTVARRVADAVLSFQPRRRF